MKLSKRLGKLSGLLFLTVLGACQLALGQSV